MTLIACATYGKRRAEFITDSTSYSPSADQTGTCTKHVTLNHLDAAVLCQGPLGFANLIRAAAFGVSGQVENFDEFLDSAPLWLREYRQYYRDDVLKEAQREGTDWLQSTVILIGWSDRAQEFVAQVFASKYDFDPRPVAGAWIYPRPWSAQPTEMDIETLPEDDPEVEAIREKWLQMPPRPVPARLDDWRTLAREVRQSRGHGYARVLVGGHVTHTRLERGSVISKRIHTYDDTGAEFAKMVYGSLHPVSLAAPCHCRSGVPFGECCLEKGLAKPCYCESGTPLGECCWRRVDQAEEHLTA